MARPALSPVACVPPACHQCRHAGQGHLGLRKVSGQEHLRRWRCRPCGAAFSARRGSALCTTQRPEATAAEVLPPLGASGRVRATARVVQGWTEPGARRVRVAGRHAEGWHDPHGRDLRLMAWECAAQGRGVKKRKNAVPSLPGVPRATGGRRPPWPLTARWWWP